MKVLKRAHIKIFPRQKPHRFIQNSNMNTRVSFKKLLSENTNEFCKHSNLHGLKYLVHHHLYPAERIFFALCFVMIVAAAAYFITDAFAKWQTAPVIVGLSPNPSFIVNEPFPAVTLCNLNQASKKKAQQFDEDSSEYAMLQMLCNREFNTTLAEGIDWNTYEEFIVNISQPCDEMIIACNYGAVDYNCSKIFRTTVTAEGLCCVFNMLHPKFMYNTQVSALRNFTSYNDDAVPVNWGSQSGYPKELPDSFYPRAAIGTGETLGLSLTFDINRNDYYCSSASSVGLKMALHSPAETPNVKEIGTLLAAGSEIKIRITADKNEAAPDLRSIHKKYRQCLFDDEANLTYFAHYNRRNCEMECQAKQWLSECQCITHYMPAVSEASRICGIRDALCINRLIRTTGNSSKVALEECQRKCWPSCFDLKFDSDFYFAPISHSGFEIANKFVKNVTSEYAEKNMAIVHIYYTDNRFRSTRQTEFIGMTEFLSSVGGLMGLFMGFSFISIAEFIYFAILRPYHVMKRHERIRYNSDVQRRMQESQICFVSQPWNPGNHQQN